MIRGCRFLSKKAGAATDMLCPTSEQRRSRAPSIRRGDKKLAAEQEPRCFMPRSILVGAVLTFAFVAGCRSLEREGSSPLPDNAPPLTYAEMINRARGQATSALDAYYIDAWMELEQAAQRLEQTARLLPKSTHIPEDFKLKVEPEADLLRQDAVKLLDAARAKNATQVNETMQRINLRIRQLRPEEKMPSDKK
jgi:hypothetical protein